MNEKICFYLGCTSDLRVLSGDGEGSYNGKQILFLSYLIISKRHDANMKKNRRLKMVDNYDICNEIFWGLNSFHYALEEQNVWDIGKYWQLEFFLIKLCKSLNGQETLSRKIAAELYFLGRSVNDLLEFYRDPACYTKLENYIEDEAEYCKDNFNHIMRILWGRIPFDHNDYMFNKNPLMYGN